MTSTEIGTRGASGRGAATDRPVPFLLRGSFLLPLGALAVFLTAWEYAGRSIDPLLFAPPSKVIGSYGELGASGQLVDALTGTLSTLGAGFLLALATGIPIGVLLGRQRTLARLVEPYIIAVYATPAVVLIPLIVIWFGIGFSGRLFIVWLMAVIPVILETVVGVREGRKDLVEVARHFGAGELTLVRHVILPAAVPYVLAGARVGAGRAIIGVLLGELFLELTGLGGIIQTGAAYFQVADMLAAVFVYVLLSVLIIGAIGAMERRLSAWKGPDAD